MGSDCPLEHDGYAASFGKLSKMDRLSKSTVSFGAAGWMAVHPFKSSRQQLISPNARFF